MLISEENTVWSVWPSPVQIAAQQQHPGDKRSEKDTHSNEHLLTV